MLRIGFVCCGTLVVKFLFMRPLSFSLCTVLYLSLFESWQTVGLPFVPVVSYSM